MNQSTNTQSSDRLDDVQAEVEAIIREAIATGATHYLCGCKDRVDEFVRRHYSFRGALRIHAHAVGWDIIRVPINIVWSIVNMVLALIGFVVGLVGLDTLKARIEKIPPGLETDMDQQISWLIVTELLQLPYKHGNMQSERDALMQEILKDPGIQRLLDERLEAFVAPAQKPDFMEKLKKKLDEYAATRTGSADFASNVVLLIGSKIALGAPNFGTLGAGTAVSAAVAKSIAVSNFWLGSTIGSYYYAIVPVAVSMRLLIAVTAVIAVVLALVSTFIGIVTDPLQAKLGLHQKRLRQLISAIEDDLHDRGDSKFQLREKYIGRLFDLVDVITTVGRSM